MDLQNIDILEKVLEWLETNDLICFMMTNSQMRILIGRSNTWLRFTPLLSIDRSYFKHDRYTQLCEGLIDNPMTCLPGSTNQLPIRMRDYYGEHYYCYRYYSFIWKMDGYLNLYNIFNSTKKDLQRFKRIITEFYKKDKMLEYRKRCYKILYNNVHHLHSLLRDTNPDILKQIFLNPNNYDMKFITINVHNTPNSKFLLSKFGLDFIYDTDVLLIPHICDDIDDDIDDDWNDEASWDDDWEDYEDTEGGETAQSTNETTSPKEEIDGDEKYIVNLYGDGNYSYLLVPNVYYGESIIQDTFKEIGERIGLKPGKLHSAVSFILGISNKLFKRPSCSYCKDYNCLNNENDSESSYDIDDKIRKLNESGA